MMQNAGTDSNARRLSQALGWLQGHLSPQANLQSDSRSVQPGDAFLGYRRGPDETWTHFQDAIGRGAAAVLWDPEVLNSNWLERCRALPYSQVCHLAVPRLVEMAGPLASSWYGHPSRDLFMVGVTGTNGKTSCCYWTAQALIRCGVACAMIGTLGAGLPGMLNATGFTTPTAPELQRLLAQIRKAPMGAVAMEVSSHALTEARVAGTHFDVAVLTNFGHDHLDYHGSLDAYHAAKFQLFRWPDLRFAIINVDDPIGLRLAYEAAGHTRVIGYGIECNLRASKLDFVQAAITESTPTRTILRVVSSSWGQGDLTLTKTLGRFNISNILAVFTVLLAYGLTFTRALQLVAKLNPVPGRMQKIGGLVSANQPLVIVDYAHNPDALERVLLDLRGLAEQRGGRLLCLFGCGGQRDTDKRPMMGEVASRLADEVTLTSDNPRQEDPLLIIGEILEGMVGQATPVRSIPDRALAIARTIAEAQAVDVILVAGKGHESVQIFGQEKRPFSDSEHAELALKLRSSEIVVVEKKTRRRQVRNTKE